MVEERVDPNSERGRFLFGRGEWTAFRNVGARMSDIEAAAVNWTSALRGIEKPWLVWNAHPDWCWVQQNLVESVGWTPVVGFDPRVGAPDRLTRNAVVVNFNADLGLTYMHPVFVLEFVFLFVDRIAFWHSDLLLPTETLAPIVRRFEAIEQGETIATSTWRLSRFWRRPGRVWELLTCTTREASRQQFELGSGWWSNICAHINCPSDAEAERRKTAIWWDHGGGILYWKRRYGGRLKTIPISQIEGGHFSPTSQPNRFRRVGVMTTRYLKDQLDQTIPLESACAHMGIEIPQYDPTPNARDGLEPAHDDRQDAGSANLVNSR